ncbi:MAG: AAA family ATPase, partial [Deltaproteobacteria bacterium]|nr:AAA family ATPase [Deltaproteobacteria bacterium]
PRRFGKSLTLSALDAFFSGRVELFTGLAVESYMCSPAFVYHPVIRVDMSAGTLGNTIADLSENVMNRLQKNAERHNVSLRGSYFVNSFHSLIMDVKKCTGQKIVLLIDEYDAPVIDAITSSKEIFTPGLLAARRDAMQDFYLVIKLNEEMIEMAFITGITKFSRMGVFSKLNNLNDISLSSDYSTFMGYTQEELEIYFEPFIALTADKLKIEKHELLNKIKNRYDGFSFDGIHTLYNPFSILNFFKKVRFSNFWMESGSNAVIRNFLKDKVLTVDQFQGMDFSYDSASTPGEIDATSSEGFLYQSGYLTLKYIDDENFVLEYPNLEVRESISKLFLETLGTDLKDINYAAKELSRCLASVDISGMVRELVRLLASIHYKDHLDGVSSTEIKIVKTIDGKVTGTDLIKVPLQQLPSEQANKLESSKGEYYYRSLLHACFWMAGAKVTAEKGGNLRNLDLEVCYGSLNYVFELKMSENARGAVAAAKRGMGQIHSRGYGLSMKNPILISISIGRSERNIVCCLFKKNGGEACFTVEYGGDNAPSLSHVEIGALPPEDVAGIGALPSDDAEKQ